MVCSVCSIAKESKEVENIIISRKIDQVLLDLNDKGFLNGHTPFSAYLAFISTICSYLFDYKFIISSNERSANEANVDFLNEQINHQYSKSFEFEKSFREYSKEYLSDNIEYSSLLRPLYELQISKIFSKYKKYLTLFRSCNVGAKNNSFCCQCPKCLSIYISLFPFLTEKELNSIFSKNLFENEKLKEILLRIIGDIKPKPFECVLTYEEAQLGLFLATKKYQSKSLPYLLKFWVENYSNKYRQNLELLKSWDDQNFLTEEFSNTLKGKIE
ncbi:MAG: hypothetical protein G01um101493_178 [Microgenomates group bacterium Gr01-1014_93]|nr:MAG: hypothetical protein G01um101493_178 [Microgenomates group bacterium Gr01-1014_93]